MKIAIVHSFYSSSSPSGENTVVNAQINALRNKGHDVQLVSKSTDIESTAKFYTGKAALAAANLYGPSANSQLEQFNPDVVHVHNLFPNWGTRWLRQWGSRTVSTLHNYRSVCSSGLLWRDGQDCRLCIDHGTQNAVRYRCYRDSTLSTLPLAWASRDAGSKSPVIKESNTLIVLNDQAAKLYSELYPEQSVELVPNFAGESILPTSTEGRDWIFVGRLTTEKGVEWLLNNWPSHEKLHFVGSGPLEARVERSHHLAPDRFRFHGRVGSTETRALIRNSAGLILPSMWSEGIPTVALEALQSGTPILISDKCSAAESLTEGNAGSIFGLDEDGTELHRAIMLTRSNQLQMRLSAQSLYSRKFSENAWTSRIEDIYARVVDGLAT